MATDTNHVGEKKTFLTNTSYLSEGKIKFLQINNTRQDKTHWLRKNMRKDSLSPYVYMRCDTPSFCTHFG